MRFMVELACGITVAGTGTGPGLGSSFLVGAVVGRRHYADLVVLFLRRLELGQLLLLTPGQVLRRRGVEAGLG